jgi:ketosteroid isomerase-like protein
LNADEQNIVGTLERIYAALSDNDHVRLNQLFCEDFHAFENGVHMTGRELLDLMSRYHAEGRRYQWSVNSPQFEMQGDLGVVVYLNHGSITEVAGSAPIPMSWLETVLLRRQASGWRVAFLHSTRTAAAQRAA